MAVAHAPASLGFGEAPLAWTPVHDSSLFGLDFSQELSFILDKLAFCIP